MIGDLIAAAIGQHIDESDGDGGALGALVGVLVWKVARRAVPLAIVAGGAYAGWRYLNRRPTGSTATA